MMADTQRPQQQAACLASAASASEGESRATMAEQGEEMISEPATLLLYALFVLGSYVILSFVRSEIALARAKRRNGAAAGLKFTYQEMFQYRLDHYFSTSKWAKPALLLSFTFVLIVLGAGLLSVVSDDDDDGGVSASTWVAWTYVADPGTHADAEGAAVRFVSFCVSIGGMLIFALMIGIISESISEKVDDLKKGRSRVIESSHTLMLGWSDKSLAIIEQIALANESEGGGYIVVLADNDKEEMEATLRHATESSEQALRLLGTTVVFRSGNPLLEHELRKVSVVTARAIIVLSTPDVDPDVADSTMVRQVLALKSLGASGGEGIRGHVVTEMQDIDNRGLVRLVWPSNIEVVVAHDIIGRLMIQCAREPGLAYVLENMLGFDGSEFYFERWPELVGKTFLQVTCRFDDAVPVGVKRADGRICINPENGYVIEEGDKILCLAEDNDTYSVNDGTYSLKQGTVPTTLVPKRGRERLLFCGWRRDMADMIVQLDEYVEEGSELWLFNVVPAAERTELLKDKDNKDEVKTTNLAIKNAVGNPIVRRNLRLLSAVDSEGRKTGETATLDEFDSILILSDENAPDMESSDSRSLASLLIIQELQRELVAERRAKAPRWSDAEVIRQPCDPISEILDTRTRSLLQVAGCKGYVMSNHIVSLWLSQVAEDRDMNVVLGELLSAEGCETYIRDIGLYLDLKKGGGKNNNTKVNDTAAKRSFWDVALLARERREVAVGYKPRGMSWPEASDLILNPPDKARPRRWEEGDVVLVFAFN